ncbi:hypothetical protein TYRP_015783 [Tyrophagus putrescentiae]|nr:hypothetical protein TYRP_015783 [Tyrophagus putrescentiae]
MKNIDAVLNSFTESNLPKPTVESLAVQVDVLKLIAEKLNQTEEFKFSEKFAQFEQYLDPSVTETAVLCIEDRVLRLEVLYIRLMVDIVSSVHDDDTLFRQEGMQAILLEQVKYYEMQKQTFFGVNQLFPAFYFVVRRLVEEFQNWEQLPWLADNNLPCHSFDILEEKVEEEKYTLESRISRLLRRRDDAWCSVLNITKNLLQRSIDKDVFVRINDSIDYNTGTVYLFLILVAKCYQSAVFYNRLEVNFDDQINRRHSWKAFTEFGKLFHEYYESGGVIQELTTLFYPLLFHQQNGRLVLSVTDVVTLTCQLAEMNFETYSHYQCMYFQMAFSAIHYHLIWEQLEKNNALKSGARYLIPFTTFDMITTWESVFKNFSSAYSIPFTQQNANYSTWNVIKPRWVIILLTLLTTIARKYIYSEFVNRTARNEFPYLKSVFKHFDRILGKNQLTGHAIVAAFEQILG